MNSNDKFNQDPEQFAGFPMLKRSFEAVTDEEIKNAPDLLVEYDKQLLNQLKQLDPQDEERAAALDIDRALSVLSLNRANLSNAQKTRLNWILANV